MKIALIPGSFDPITLGHYDIIERASLLFDQIKVCIFHNAEKNGFLTPEKRFTLAKKAISNLKNVEVILCENRLLADVAKETSATTIVKGLRNTIDFSYEHDLFLINHSLCNIETVFLPAKAEHQHLSSTFVREMIRYGQPLFDYMPPNLREIDKSFFEN